MCKNELITLEDNFEMDITATMLLSQVVPPCCYAKYMLLLLSLILNGWSSQSVVSYNYTNLFPLCAPWSPKDIQRRKEEGFYLCPKHKAMAHWGELASWVHNWHGPKSYPIFHTWEKTLGINRTETKAFPFKSLSVTPRELHTQC